MKTSANPPRLPRRRWKTTVGHRRYWPEGGRPVEAPVTIGPARREEGNRECSDLLAGEELPVPLAAAGVKWGLWGSRGGMWKGRGAGGSGEGALR